MTTDEIVQPLARDFWPWALDCVGLPAEEAFCAYAQAHGVELTELLRVRLGAALKGYRLLVELPTAQGTRTARIREMRVAYGPDGRETFLQRMSEGWLSPSLSPTEKGDVHARALRQAIGPSGARVNDEEVQTLRAMEQASREGRTWEVVERPTGRLLKLTPSAPDADDAPGGDA
jgi:hypothetical protein